MAKKKQAQEDKPAERPLQPEKLKPQEQAQHKLPAAGMDDPAAKFERVKLLNSVLLREIAEKRKEVKHLLEFKKSLESELTRSSSEIESLKAALAQFNDGKVVEIELEKEVVSAFLGAQIVNEMRKGMEAVLESTERMKGENKGLIREKEEVQRRLKDLESKMEEDIRERNEKLKARFEEIGSLQQRVRDLCAEIESEREAVNQAILERDVLEQDSKFQLEKIANESKEELMRMEGMVTEKANEALEMNNKYEEGVKVYQEREREIEVMATKMEAMEGDLEKSRELLEDMKRKADETAGQKAELEREKSELISKISELEEESSKLHNVVSEAKEREEELKRELSSFLKEKKERDEDFEKLVEENSKAMKSLDVLAKELENAKQRNQELIEEKNMIDQAKIRQESEIGELQGESSQLRDALSALQESSRVQGEKNNELLSQMRHLEVLLTVTSIKRREAPEALDQEKLNGATLWEEVWVLLKKMEEAAKELEGLRMGHETLLGEKKELESIRSILMEEKALAESRVFEAKQELDNLQCRMQSKDAVLEQCLAMLKNTALKFSAENDNGVAEDIVLNEWNMNGELEAYAVEVEAIRSTIRSKEAKVEEMKQKVESLQCSVMEVRKKKSFWTLVSSATTIVAAVMSFAYACKVN
ncbi:hypothetical protein Ancab_000795 [Ancistrocladus abbreviatus]